MRKLNHPNVMKVLDKVKDTGAKLCKEDEDEEDENNQVWDWEREGIWKAHIVFELATGGDLFSYLESQQGFSEDETKFLSWQLVLGLDHLHANEVAHRGGSLPDYRLTPSPMSRPALLPYRLTSSTISINSPVLSCLFSINYSSRRRPFLTPLLAYLPSLSLRTTHQGQD
jgi:hypothetical protein